MFSVVGRDVFLTCDREDVKRIEREAEARRLASEQRERDEKEQKKAKAKKSYKKGRVPIALVQPEGGSPLAELVPESLTQSLEVETLERDTLFEASRVLSEATPAKEDSPSPHGKRMSTIDARRPLASLKLSPMRSLSHDRSDLTDAMRSNPVLSSKQILEARAVAEKQQREDIAKVREINKVMKRLGKEEHQKNIELF